MSNILVVGGKRNGERIKWFGNRVDIDGVPYALHRIYYNGRMSYKEYYLCDGHALVPAIDNNTVERIEVCK